MRLGGVCYSNARCMHISQDSPTTKYDMLVSKCATTILGSLDFFRKIASTDQRDSTERIVRLPRPACQTVNYVRNICNDLVGTELIRAYLQGM